MCQGIECRVRSWGYSGVAIGSPVGNLTGISHRTLYNISYKSIKREIKRGSTLALTLPEATVMWKMSAFTKLTSVSSLVTIKLERSSVLSC